MSNNMKMQCFQLKDRVKRAKSGNLQITVMLSTLRVLSNYSFSRSIDSKNKQLICASNTNSGLKSA